MGILVFFVMEFPMSSLAVPYPVIPPAQEGGGQCHRRTVRSEWGVEKVMLTPSPLSLPNRVDPQRIGTSDPLGNSP